MRIIYVVPNVPSHIRIRPFNFLRLLSVSHEVSVLCVATAGSDDHFASELRKYCENVEVFKLHRWRSVWNCIAALFSSKSVRFSYFYSRSLQRRLERKVIEEGVDLVHAEHLKSIPMVKGVAGRVPIVFDAVDCVSMLEDGRMRILKNPFRKLFSWMEWKRMRRWEMKASRLVEGIVISSEADRDYYPVPNHSRKELRVIPNGVDLELFKFQEFEAQQDLITFGAKLDYFPNEDAVLYFYKTVWPLLRNRRPEMRWHIAGNRPPRTILQINGKDNIRVVGSVPDLRPYVGKAWVAICPLRLQAGIQNKILEAMALGVPVVATSICCRGLKVVPGRDLLVADTPEQFAASIELLMDDCLLREKIALAGRAYVEQHHHWGRAVGDLLGSYALAIKRPRRVLHDKPVVCRTPVIGGE